MKVLVACEESQVVTEQFILRGHDAMSCDIAYDGAKGLPHYRGDVRDLLNVYFDLVIFHPVCKFITNSGVRWLYDQNEIDGKPYGPKFLFKGDGSRWRKMIEACNFFNLRHEFNSPQVATENPIPHKYARQMIGMYDQCIQPWHFGHEKMKATCFWLKGLPPLIPTYIVGPPPKDKKERNKWQDVWMASPGPERERLRSRTYEGIAKAMAEQWGGLSLNN